MKEKITSKKSRATVPLLSTNPLKEMNRMWTHPTLEVVPDVDFVVDIQLVVLDEAGGRRIRSFHLPKIFPKYYKKNVLTYCYRYTTIWPNYITPVPVPNYGRYLLYLTKSSSTISQTPIWSVDAVTLGVVPVCWNGVFFEPHDFTTFT